MLPLAHVIVLAATLQLCSVLSEQHSEVNDAGVPVRSGVPCGHSRVHSQVDAMVAQINALNGGRGAAVLGGKTTVSTYVKLNYTLLIYPYGEWHTVGVNLSATLFQDCDFVVGQPSGCDDTEIVEQGRIAAQFGRIYVTARGPRNVVERGRESNPYFFSIHLCSNAYASSALQHFHSGGARSVAIIYEDTNDFYRGLGEQSVRSALQLGFNVTYASMIPAVLPQAALRDVLNTAAATRPDAIILVFQEPLFKWAMGRLKQLRSELDHSYAAVWWQGTSWTVDGDYCAGMGSECDYVVGATQICTGEAYPDELLGNMSYAQFLHSSTDLTSSFVSFPDGAALTSMFVQAIQHIYRYRRFPDSIRDPMEYSLLLGYLNSGEVVANTFYGPVKFNKIGQNVGRTPTSVQSYFNTTEARTRVRIVLPTSIAEKQLAFPAASRDCPQRAVHRTWANVCLLCFPQVCVRDNDDLQALYCSGGLRRMRYMQYEGKSARLLLPRHNFFPSFKQRAAEFFACTGFDIVFHEKEVYADSWGAALDAIIQDLGVRSCHDGECAVKPGTGIYDAYLLKSQWVSSFDGLGAIQPLNNWVKESDTILWNDVMAPVRDFLAVTGGVIRLLPMDADFTHLVVRRDLAHRFEVETGAAPKFEEWSDLAAFVKYWDGKDLNDDGEPDEAACTSLCNGEGWGYMALGGPFVTILASIMQTEGASQGIYFNATTMEALFFEEPMTLAMQHFRASMRSCPYGAHRSALPSSWSLFSKGECAVMYAHPGPANSAILNGVGRADHTGQVVWQPTIDGQYAYPMRVMIPGSNKVFDPIQQRLVDAAPHHEGSTCRIEGDSVRCVNRAPLLAGGNAVIMRKGDEDRMEMMYQFFDYLNAPAQSVEDTAQKGTWCNHWRSSHVTSSAVTEHKRVGWTENQFLELKDVIEQSLSERSNTALGLRIPGYNEYAYRAFDARMFAYLGFEFDENDILRAAPSPPPMSTFLADLTASFEQVTNNYGRLAQVQWYRSSLNRAPLTDEATLCALYRKDLERDGLSTSHCDSDITSVLIICSSVGVFVTSIGLWLQRRHSQRKRAVVLLRSGQKPVLTLSHGCKFHCFLSHCWGTGQDQIAQLKQKIQLLLPSARLFRDVDDLHDISALEAYIDESSSILFFLSVGYLRSQNCLREVRQAMIAGKPIILVHEADPTKGGAYLPDLISECPIDLVEQIFQNGKRAILPWLRLPAFLDCTLIEITRAILISTPRYKNEIVSLTMPNNTFLGRWKFPKPGHKVKLFISPHNKNAVEVTRTYILPGLLSHHASLTHNLSDVLGRSTGSFRVSAPVAALLYLNQDTFLKPVFKKGNASPSSEARVDSELVADLLALIKAGIQVIMIYERRHDQQLQEFSKFLGVCPRELGQDLFKELAIPLYSGDLYQHVLRSMVAKRLGAKQRKNLLLKQVSMRKLTRPSLLRDSACKSERVSTTSPTKSFCDVNELKCVDVLSF